MKTKLCKECLIRITCKKEYHDGLCQDAKNELGFHLYRNHKLLNIVGRYIYNDGIDVIFNDEVIKYIKSKLKRCRPPKQFRKDTIKVIERKIDKMHKIEYEDLMDQIYCGCCRDDDPPGYRD